MEKVERQKSILGEEKVGRKRRIGGDSDIDAQLAT